MKPLRRPTPPEMVLRPATHADLPDIVRLLTIDLVHSPRSGWAMPGRSNYGAAWRTYLSEIANTALNSGTVTITAERTAVAVWQPHPHPTAHVADTTLDVAAVSPAHCLHTVHTILQAGHPDGPHEDLVHIGVHPDWRRHGLATALLRHHHAHLDRQRISAVAHVDADVPRQILQRHGYTTVVPAAMPPGLNLTMLARPPRT